MLFDPFLLHQNSNVMHIILGATGHIGSALTKILLGQGEPVTAVTRDPQKGEKFRQMGAHIAVVNVLDTEKLHRTFKQGKRLYLLNLPAPPDTDTAKEEFKTVDAIISALEGSGIEKVVAESTYGAQPGDQLGDLGVLYHMEQALHALSVPHTVIRGAYYMSNWDHSLETARRNGVVHTLYPAEYKIPMVSPADIAKVAARLLLEPPAKGGLYYVEGPEPYSTTEVAEAFSAALQRPVNAVSIPKDEWIPALEKMGFSPKAAASMAAMTDITLRQDFEMPDAPIRGETTLQEHVHRLVHPKHAPVTGG